VIDFGLAAQHPRYGGDRRSRQSDGAPLRNASNHIKLLDEQPASAAYASASAPSPDRASMLASSCCLSRHAAPAAPAASSVSARSYIKQKFAQ